MRVMSSALLPARSAARATCSRTRASRSRICSAIAWQSYQRPSDGDKQTGIAATRPGKQPLTLNKAARRAQNTGMPGSEKRQDLVVFIQHHVSSTCVECGKELFKGYFIRFQREKGAMCLGCLSVMGEQPRQETRNGCRSWSDGVGVALW